MYRFLFYGPVLAILGIGIWFYSRGEPMPDTLLPAIVLLFAAASFGYGIKAGKEGDIGTGGHKIYRSRSPRMFRALLYLNYMITLAFAGWAVFLFLN